MEKLEKILEELESVIFSAEVYNDEFNGVTINNLICLGNVKDILEKHMNDGWIPVEECLPEDYSEERYIVTDADGRIWPETWYGYAKKRGQNAMFL